MSSSSLSLLGSGYLSTQGSQLVNAGGSDVRIASIGWNQNFGDIPGTVAAMAQAGFNTIRISWVDATLQANLATIKQVVAAASADGMKVIIDHHTDEAGTAADGYGAQQRNGLWIDQGPGTDGTNGAGVRGTVDAAKFQADWLTVARTFAGNSTVIGFDLDNEPTSVGHITWGGGGPTDIHAMYQTVGSAIQAVDPGALIIAEGPINYGGSFAGGGTAPEGDLSIAGAQPVTLTIPNKLVYSVHEYPTEISAMPVDSGPAAITRMNQAWGYLVTRNIAPVWVGEMGANMTTANSQAWAATLTGYMNGKDAAQGGPAFTGSQQPVSGDWWVWGYLPGQEPDGTLNANGTLNQAQKAVWSQLLPVAVSTTGTSIDTMTIGVSEDAWQGNAQFTIAVNGKQMGGVQTVAGALHSRGQSQPVTITGGFGSGAQKISVSFNNDAYGGSPSKDRNLYVTGITYNGTHYPDTAALLRNGTVSFTVPGTAAATHITSSSVNASAMSFISAGGAATGAAAISSPAGLRPSPLPTSTELARLHAVLSQLSKPALQRDITGSALHRSSLPASPPGHPAMMGHIMHASAHPLPSIAAPDHRTALPAMIGPALR